MSKSIQNTFKNPGNEFRSAPFWSLNDQLSPRELCRQLDMMKAGGFGGSFLHSRTGLITPYLSREWMHCMNEAVKHSKKTGLLAYLYDEDRWPSGFAGGFAVKNKDNWMKALIARKAGKTWKFSFITHPPDRTYNNYPYLDTLSRKAVKAFLDSTHEKYRNSMGGEFGKTITGMFTDEPNLRNPCYQPAGTSVLPWTPGFDKLFENKYGYDIRKKLPCLVEDLPGAATVRHDYWKLAGELFLENFGKQVYEWCDRHNLPYTGHYNGEDNLASQTENLGAAMPLYEYMHIPGIDHLTKVINAQLLTIKQCSSVAHQLGKKRVLSELFGASGHNLSFTEKKRAGDWDIALGVNLFCPHLWMYSLRGARKRDFPPAISFQQPYWKYNKPIEDHFARLSYVTATGTYRPELLVIHPVESSWLLHKPYKPNAGSKALNRILFDICKGLLEQHYDYDLGDETLMAKYGLVETIGGRAYLCIGKMKYPFVILPSLLTIRETTLRLLEEFMRRGGKVLSAGPLPSFLEGKPDISAGRRLKNADTCRAKDAVRTASGYLEKEISVADAAGKEIPDVLCQKTTAGRGLNAYLLANTSMDKPFAASVTIKGTGSPEYWDSMTGKRHPLASKHKDGRISLDVYFPPAASRLIVLARGNKHAGVKLSKPKDTALKKLSSGWDFRRLDDNSLTLDLCSYKLRNMKKWSAPLPAISLLRIMEDMDRKQPVSLRYSFDTSFTNRPKKLFLVLEQPEIYRIKVNGIPIIYKEAGDWVDISFKKIDISAAVLLKGRNIVELDCLFIPPKLPNTYIFTRNGVQMESIYITGDFAVAGKFSKFKDGFAGEKFVLENESPAAGLNNLVCSGYPFYAGGASFRREVNLPKTHKKSIILKMDEFTAAAANIKVNGRSAGLVFLPPYELDITKFVKPGKNTIEIEIVNTLRNLLGPHHFGEVTIRWVGHGEFEKQKGHWTDKYSFVPFGLGKVSLILSESSRF